MTIFGLSYPYTTKCKKPKKSQTKFIFELGTLYPHRTNECLLSINLFINTCRNFSTNSKALPHPYREQQQPARNFPIRSDEGLTLDFQNCHNKVSDHTIKISQISKLRRKKKSIYAEESRSKDITTQRSISSNLCSSCVHSWITIIIQKFFLKPLYFQH